MGDWKIVRPEQTENFVQNPSAEEAGNYSALPGTTVTRSTSYSKYGLYSYRVQTNADNEGISLTLEALANADHYVTFRVRGTLPASWDLSLDDANYASPVELADIDGNWTLYGLSIPAAQANGSTTLYIRQNGAGSGDFYIDGVQVEEKAYWTTYCDGSQDGCEWEGEKDGSTSRRSGLTCAGGRVRDLEDDYHFHVEQIIGAGAAPQLVNLDHYAIIPGAALNSIKVEGRPFTLAGMLTGTSESNLRARMQDLINAIAGDSLPEDDDGIQPIRIRYTGAAVQKELAVHYETGLEGNKSFRRDARGWEQIAALRFLAPDPYWLEIGETSIQLDPAAVAASNHHEFAGRLRETSVALGGYTSPWNELNVSASPASGEVLCSVVGPDKKVYIGGTFTDWNGVGGSDYVAVYDPVTDTWSTLGGASDFNGAVYALAFGPDGTLYAGGAFTDCAADPDADYLAQWDGSNWSAVSAGGVDGVRALAMGLDGTLYIGGTFTNWNTDADADYIASWDGSAYAALDTGLPSACYALAVHPDGNIYAGGGVSVTSGYVQYWDVDAEAWTDITANSLSEDPVLALAISDAGDIYAGGEFPDNTVGSGAQNPPYHIGKYNGSEWEDLGGGLFDNATTGSEHLGDVRSIAIGPDGVIWAGGDFRYIGSDKRDIEAGLAAFYGNNWSRLGHRLGVNIIYDALSIGPADPVIERNYDVYVGFNSTGVTVISANTDVENAGSAPVYPRIVLTNESATDMGCYRIENVMSGDVLLFDYTIPTDEKLTVDLRQAKKRTLSSFYGRVPAALNPDSDVGTWRLLADRTNVINVFMYGGAIADTIVWLLYRTAYKSYD